ncbi:uncharacterized protein CLUP02_14422 [Colletotrichum lupini]|uniref:Uncharacterized protein n=1 Tax=Colletotrichum lupini TaxID=145971 RepID=A0A9Q8WNA2_9PEZI|nr:uncharacterized protein CLUP02_14422 [Colletotrichum lupini]UQC88895.1 hypothetical protein CLUP02_14422 [Colletotrichum lupini]
MAKCCCLVQTELTSEEKKTQPEEKVGIGIDIDIDINYNGNTLHWWLENISL